MFKPSLVVLIILSAQAGAQVTWPTSFVGGPTYDTQDNSMQVNFTTTTAGAATVVFRGSPASITLTAISQTGTVILLQTRISLFNLGTCIVVQRYTPNVMRLAWRTAVHPTFGVNLDNYASTMCQSVTAQEVTENEFLLYDMTAATLTPTALPTALQKNFTYQANPMTTPTCGNNADGITTSTQLRLDTRNCPPTSSIIAGSGTLHCLGDHTLGSTNMIWFTDSLTMPRNYYCGVYAVSGQLATLTITRDHCAASMTATSLGSGANGTIIGLTAATSPTSSAGTGGSGGGAGAIVPSLLLLTSALFVKRWL